MRSRVRLSSVVGEMFEAMPVAMVAFSGPEHRILALNDACRQYLGRGNVIGKPYSETFPEFAGARADELLDRVYATGQAEIAGEWRLQIPQAEGLPEDRYLDLAVVPWHNTDGTVAGLVVAATDMTGHVRERRAALAQAEAADRRYEVARNIALELQAALLPATLPMLPQLKLAARYLVASDDHAAGGDWFDVLLLPDGPVALVVGDVVGHGVAAAAAMGQLRAVLGDRLVANPDLPDALREADDFAARTPALHATTLSLAVLDPADGMLYYATCGHPPPLIIAADGSARFLPSTGSGPLGTGSPPVLGSETLGPNEVVLLYSDGLIERPGLPADAAMAELAKVAGEAAITAATSPEAGVSPAEQVCRQTVEVLTRSGHADDVTTLAAQLLAEPAPTLQLELPGTLAALSMTRTALAEWLQELDVTADDQAVLQLAIAEIVMNAVEHAYPADSPGEIGLDAALGDEGYVECRVADHGAWRVPSGADRNRGYGLMLAQHLIDEVVVSHPPQAANTPRGARGTMVTLKHKLRGPATLGSPSSPSPATTLAELPFGVAASVADAAALAVVTGPVDALTGEQFSRELLAASCGGTLPLTVDMTEVSYLASAGVRALFQVRDQLTAQYQGLTLIAVPGGRVAFVLELVGLPYQAGEASGR